MSDKRHKMEAAIFDKIARNAADAYAASLAGDLPTYEQYSTGARMAIAELIAFRGSV